MFSSNCFTLTACSFLLLSVFHSHCILTYFLSPQIIHLKLNQGQLQFPQALSSDVTCPHTMRIPTEASSDLSYLVHLNLKMNHTYQGRSMHKDLLHFASSWKKVIHELQENFVFPGTNYNMHACVYMRGKFTVCKHDDKNKWATGQSIRLCSFYSRIFWFCRFCHYCKTIFVFMLSIFLFQQLWIWKL